MTFKKSGFTLIESVVALLVVLLTIQVAGQLISLNQTEIKQELIKKNDFSYFYLRLQAYFKEYDKIEVNRDKSTDSTVYLFLTKGNDKQELSLVIKGSTVILKKNNEGYVPVLTEVFNSNFCYNIEKGFYLNVEDSKKRKSQLFFTF